MKLLSEWLLTLIPVCACSVFVDMLFSSFSKKESLGKYIRFILSLCICSVIFFPSFSALFTLYDDVRALSLEKEETKMEYVSFSDEFVLEFSKEKLSRTCADKIYEKFGIRPEYISIEFSTREEEDMLFADISFFEIGLSANHKEKAQEICKYTEELLGFLPGIKIVGG